MRHYSTFVLPSWMTMLGDFRQAGGIMGDPGGGCLPPYVFVDYHQIDSGLNATGPYLGTFCGIDRLANWVGLTDEQKSTFRERAVPVPGALLREAVELTNDARRDIPSTVIAAGFSAEQYQTYAREHPEWAFLAGIPELRNLRWIDLPTSHWPMWSRPAELAAIIGDVAKSAH